MEQPQQETKLFSLTVAAVLMFCVLTLVLIQVFARYLSMSPTWTEEMVRWFWVWAACLGFGAVEHGGEHVSMGYLPAKLAPKARTILFLLFDLASFAVGVNLVWLSWESVRINWDATASTIPISRSFFYTSILVGSLLVVFHSARHTVRRIITLKSKGNQDVAKAGE